MKFSDRLLELRFNDYSSYLRSNLWRKTRKRFFSSKIIEGMKNYHGRICCECCFTADCILELHHRSYNSLGDEQLDHLILVCDPCHEAIHRRAKQENVDLWVATDLVAKEPLRSSKATSKTCQKSDNKPKYSKEPKSQCWAHVILGDESDVFCWLEKGWSKKEIAKKLRRIKTVRAKQEAKWLARNNR